jgi:GH35 family endo-1,4-beta-xylanase
VLFRSYAIVAYFPGWSKGYTSDGIDQYAAFVRQLVQRYRDRIKQWEIWNEPNIFFWQGPKDMYAELLKQAYAAIKKANPDAKVLGCSTAGIDHNFIKRTMQLGAPFDILTIHPYRGHLDDKAFISDLQKVAELVKNPDGSPRKAWITEMGWATHTPHNSMAMDFQVTTQRRQAELIARAYIDAIASGVAPNISWYDFRNDGADPFNFEHNMGIITRDFRPKPAYRAYATMTRMLQGARAGKAVEVASGVIAYEFSPPGGKRVVALWSVSGDKAVAVPAAKPMVLTGLMGDTETLAPADGKVSVPLRNEVPVFLTEAGE